MNQNIFSVNIQHEKFIIEDEYQKLLFNNNIGALVTFCGLVRDFSYINNKNIQEVTSIYLECYESMAKKIITQIILEAKEKFNILRATVIHRIGLLTAGEQIVFLGVASKHRKEAFLACEYIIDFLKAKAPFWKKEITPVDSFWVKQKDSDKIE